MGSVGDSHRIKYETDFTDRGVKIHHIHYEDDSQEYEVYDSETGEYIDTAYTTNELREIITDFNSERGNK